MTNPNNFTDFGDNANNSVNNSVNNPNSNYFSSYNSSSAEDNDETTSMSVADIASVSSKSDDGLFSASPESHKNSNKRRVKNRSAAPFLYSLLVVLILIVGAYLGTSWYFHDRVVPGVHFGNDKLTERIVGKKADDVERVVEDAVSSSVFKISDDRGNDLDAKFDDLHVKPDVKATVRNIMSAKHDNFLTMLFPWVGTNVSLSVTTDHSGMNAYVVNYFVKESDRAVPYTPEFNKKEKKFVVKDGMPGRSIEILPVDEAIKKMIANPGHVAKVSVVYRRVNAPITQDDAQKVADQLNTLLSKKIKFDNSNGKDFTLPKEVLASFVKINSDDSSHKISYEIDNDAVGKWLSENLPKELNQEKVNQEDSVDKDGKVILTINKGVNGVSIKYSDDISKKVVSALKDQKDIKVSVPAEVSKFKVDKKLIEMRIVVDKSKQIATVYKNDEVVKTFPVCTGLTNLAETDNGTFYIYLRYDVQTMRGVHEFDGTTYVLPGIRWVSYFNGGESFHTAAWNSVGISTGDPAKHGSNGCVNMYEADAHWIYENCPRGTIVQVIGTTPNGPVRK